MESYNIGEIQKIESSVKFVKYNWQTYSGVRLAKIVPIKQHLENETKLCRLIWFVPSYADEPSDKLQVEKAFKCIKIESVRDTLRIHPLHKNMAISHVQFYNWEQGGDPYCPRSQLLKALEELKTLGYTVKAGFEIEFQVFEKDRNVPVEKTSYCMSNGNEIFSEDMMEIATLLSEAGIETELMHLEIGDSQIEFVLQYQDLLTAIINYDYARDIISAYFLKKGQRAVFLSKSGESCTNGCHVHLSIWKDGLCAVGDPNGQYGLTEDGQHFIGGILEYFEQLMQFLAPHPNSMRRILPGSFVGAFKYWGIENKEAPIRVCEYWNDSKPITHFEVKTLDHMANMYLAMAAIVHVGFEGIKNKIKLPEPLNIQAESLSQEEQTLKGISKLPTSFKEKKESLLSKKGESLRNFFGENLIHNLLVVAEQENNFFADKSLEEEVAIIIKKY